MKLPGTLNHKAVGTLSDMYEQALENIDEAVKRVEEVSRLANRQSETIDMAMFRKALSLKEAPTAKTKTAAVNNIPVSRNKQFFGREDIIKALDEQLLPGDNNPGMSSVAIYGLGGLLIFDNVESGHIFDLYWPVAEHGSILITTRRRGYATQPVSVGLELKEFDSTQGARFLVHSLLNEITDEFNPEFKAAMGLSEKLSGLALAISQMAALINARSMSLDKFMILYDKHQKKVHRERRTGWKYAGYNHALDTVWELSFEALEPDSRLLLGILSFLVPDTIPLAFRGDAIEQLEDLALIRQDIASATVSIHRLVQSEFLFHISAEDRQKAFGSSVSLLLEVFPPRGKSRLVPGDWEKGAKYIGQVLSLLDKYKKSLSEAEPLQSSTNLLELICDAAWFLESQGPASNLTKVLDIGFLAYQRWNDDEKDKLILGYLLGNSGLHDLYLGEFNSAKTKTQECLDIYLSKLESDEEQILNTYNNMGLVYGCQGDYQRGADFLARAEDILKLNPAKHPEKGLLINANTSRNDYCSGRYIEGEKRLGLCLAEATQSNSVFWLIYIHIAYAALFCRSGELTKAEDHLKLSAEGIEEWGSSRNFAMTALQAYRLGRLKYAQEKYEESIKYFQKSEDIDQVNQSPQVFHARNVYALSRAMCRIDAQKEVGEQLRTKAVAMRAGVLKGRAHRNVADGDDFDAFDMLIRIFER
ncbi:hypothetical protein DL98DRAFT_576474 [Cadophora sp. DSE1049]|nr:hypothetical protein DL98DRAFT_576474 [Cadophora sp. DSE1049]